MNHRQFNLLLMTATALAVTGLALSGTGSPVLLALLSVPLVLIMPGYALTLAFFPGDKLELAERVAFSLGMSLALTAIGSLLLNLSPWGLQQDAWAVLLGSITLLTSGMALLRWQEQVGDYRQPTFTPVYLRLSFDQALLFLLAGLVAVGAFAVAYYGELAQNRPAFTQLWMLPVADTSEPTIRLGISNREQETIGYRLVVMAGETPVIDNPAVRLEPDDTWETTLTLTEVQAYGVIRARLFRLYAPLDACAGDDPPDACALNQDVYREVVLWNMGRQ